MNDNLLLAITIVFTLAVYSMIVAAVLFGSWYLLQLFAWIYQRGIRRFDRWVDSPTSHGWNGWPHDLLDRYPDAETIRLRRLIDRTGKDTTFLTTCNLCDSTFKEAEVLKLWQTHANHRRTRHAH